MDIVAVGIGGLLGAMARYAVAIFLPAANGFPYGTLAANLLGCLFLAWFFTVTTRRWAMNPRLKLAIGTGFTGSFTTFSTFSVETLQLLSSHQYTMVVVYILVSVVGGQGFAVLGSKIAVMTVWPNRKGSGQ